MRSLLLVFTTVCGSFLVSCSSPGGLGIGSGSTHDVMGHRAGPQGFRTVVIDAGHGGKDSGAVVNGIKEKDLALDTARRLKAELSGQFNVVMMRNDDTFVDLDERAARASKYGDGVLVSIHYNSSGSSIAGPETYYWRVDSYSMAKRAQQQMRGVSPSNGSRGLVRRRIRLTRNPEIPSMLCEIGYLSNGSELRRCADPGYRAQMARALANAIRAQAQYGDAGMGPLPQPINAPLSRPTDARE